MELGYAKLKKNGINFLSNSINLKHGLAWTDGCQLNITQVKHLAKGIGENEKQIKLGNFDYVESVCWSISKSGYCFLCVVHRDTVSIWNIEGSHSALSSKQLRKISVLPIAQGCLWNPSNDVLSILTKDQCNFYFNHLQNKSSFALQLPSLVDGGKISCGTWSPDGNRLYLGVGNSVVEYSWNNINNISEYTVSAWKVPNLDGDLCCVTPLNNGQLVFSAEMPLDALLDDDLFETPDIDYDDDNDVENPDKDNNNVTGPDQNAAAEVEDSVDEDVIRPRLETETSLTHKLLNLDIRPKENEVQTSQLIVVDTVPYMDKVANVAVPNLLVPNLLHFHAPTVTVVVSGNSHTQIYMYDCRQADNLVNIGVIELEPNERAKGLGTFHWLSKSLSQIGVMVGRIDDDDSAFLSSSLEREYKLELQVYSGPLETSMRPKSHSVPAVLLNDASITDAVKKKHKDKKSDSPKFKDLKSVKAAKSPKSPKVDAKESGHFDKLFRPFFNRSSSKGPKIIDLSKNQDENVELEVETVSFAEQAAVFRQELYSLDEEILVPIPSDKKRISIEDELSVGSPSQSGSITMSSRSNSLPNILDQVQENIAKLESEETPVHPDLAVEDNPNVSSSKEKATKKKKKHHKKHKAKSTENIHNMVHEDVAYTSSEVIDDVQDELEEDGASVPSASATAESQSILEDRRDESKVAMTTDVATAANDEYVSEISAIECEVKQQALLLERLSKQMDTLSTSLSEISVVQNYQYPTIDEIELAYLMYTSEIDEESIQKTFLLDNGRLKFEAVLEAFGLVSLELIIDDIAVVVSANADGYIPMKFDCGSAMHIRGRRRHKTQERTEL
ncbi:uncharacterized protein LOC141905329 isoform X1 [Tubulanus polymorphus]|uniref:uncharacterized protein LOC141905329 isoform X1 n=1 Tax=Tubulanus polymorphus TaxID=672921 RepID=UPI003DA2A38A